ncbi:PAS domain S-box-containing protein [Phenylobacterium haematophilum]|uniref:Sensory/regulatory protein RpfC n=1 Tax=Phenylobacterium haematophilum TaxID=98513 RepID=A0A839ZV73_9CAUL|nr:ATP-binding protein [Phenylobacterium haematophilum]MBB3890365.1 PAS domain S-box-containing protein [Phenylobacterium haematophilum]
MVEDRLERVQRLANAGAWEWTAADDALSCSEPALRLLGLPPGPCTADEALARIPSDDRRRVEDAVQRALDTGCAYALDHRIKLPDGAVRVLRHQGAPRFSPSGAAIGLAGALQDVTPLRAAEAASHRSQQMLAGMLKISPEAIVVADSQARIILFSAGAEAMFGYSAEEALGRSVEDLMPARFRERHQQAVHRFASGTRPSLRMHERAEILGLRRNGEEFPAEASLARLETPSGTAFTTIVRNLSERKAAEARLVQAREEAEEASRAKSTFLANMSHEIRTPLNGVLGVAGALARTDLDAPQREMVQLIETSGRALQALLSDILDLAKVDAGRLCIRDEPFDLAGMVRAVFALFQASAAEKAIGFSLEMDREVCDRFHGDDLRIRQVLSNLLSNAVKFTAHGEVRLRVLSRGLAGDVRRVRFVVEDTGVGFPTEAAEALFDRFEQADSSITRQFGGTGLGLAISKSLVDLMGGEIVASSSPGEGATFAFELPLRRLVREPSSPPPAPIHAPKPSDRPVRVLLAEDHPTNRRVVELILGGLPVDLTCVENGQQAVEAAAEQTYDLILMDMQMPIMDGVTAVSRIRAARPLRLGPRICMLTANAMPEHREASQRAGADAFLVKPLDAAELIAEVMEARDAPPEPGTI